MSEQDGSKLQLVVPDDGGAVGRFLTGIFGRSYRTTIAGGVATVCGGIVAVSAVLPGTIPAQIVTLASVLAPLVGGAGLLVAKDSRVSGRP